MLSHGQASVERGFSVNKEIEVENLYEHYVVSHRIICDQLRAVGGVLNVPVTKKRLAAAASSRQKYEKYLQKKGTKRRQVKNRERENVLYEIEELKEKKKRMKLDIDSLVKSADDLSIKAEKTGQLTLVTKSNALRKTAKDKTL